MRTLPRFSSPRVRQRLRLPPQQKAVYATRRLPGWAGPCLRVQRSGDSAQRDIGFGATGYLDMAAAVDFQGGGTLTVVTWYDQSGNANDATGTTPCLRWQNDLLGLQPVSMIAASGNADQGFLTMPAGVTASRQAYTAVAVLAPAGGVANSWGHFALGTSATATDNVSALYDNSGGASAAEYILDSNFRNSDRLNFSVPVGVPSCIVIRSDAATATFRVNGRQMTWSAAPATTLTGGYIGKAA